MKNSIRAWQQIAQAAIACPASTCGRLEREWIRFSKPRKGRVAMLVLSRKSSEESVVAGGSDGFHRLFKVKLLEIRGRT